MNKMADRKGFMRSLVNRGLTRDQILDAMEKAEKRGAFTPKQPVIEETPAVPVVEETPAEPKESYIQGLGKFYTEDIPESIKGMNVRAEQREERVQKPTVFGEMAKKATGAKGFLGDVVEGFAGAPERIGRTAAQYTGLAGDVAGTALEIGAKAVNRTTGGFLKEKVYDPVMGAVTEAVGDSKIAQTIMDKWQGLSEAEKANYGSALDLAEALGWGGGKAAKKVASKTIASPKLIDDVVGKISATLTGVDEKALRMGGDKVKREALKKAYGTFAETGAQLADVVDNAFDYMPDYNKINEALKRTPAIDVVPMAKKLDKLAGKPESKEIKVVAKQIKEKADEIRGIAARKGQGGFVDAADMLEYRKELDDIIDDAFGKENSEKYTRALIAVRKDIKEAIVKNAQGTEYAATMKEFSEKLDALDRIKSLLGKTSDDRLKRGENFVRNINNKGKTEQKKWLKDFEDLFGGDFVKKSELARFAEIMGDAGTGAWLPRWTTGKSILGQTWLGPTLGFAAGSPKIASRVTLPVTSTIAKPFRAVADATSRIPSSIAGGAGVGAVSKAKRGILEEMTN